MYLAPNRALVSPFLKNRVESLQAPQSSITLLRTSGSRDIETHRVFCPYVSVLQYYILYAKLKLIFRQDVYRNDTPVSSNRKL